MPNRRLITTLNSELSNIVQFLARKKDNDKIVILFMALLYEKATLSILDYNPSFLNVSCHSATILSNSSFLYAFGINRYSTLAKYNGTYYLTAY